MNELGIVLLLLAVVVIVSLIFELRSAVAEIRRWEDLVDRLLYQRDGKLP